MTKQFLIQVQFGGSRVVKDEVVFGMDIEKHVALVAQNHTEGAVPKVTVCTMDDGDLIRAKRVLQELDYINSDSERRETVISVLDLLMRLRQLLQE